VVGISNQKWGSGDPVGPLNLTTGHKVKILLSVCLRLAYTHQERNDYTEYAAQ